MASTTNYYIEPKYCRTCYEKMPLMDVPGMPRTGMVFVCPECGEMYCNDIAMEYYEGRFEGLPEFWMNKRATT
jgi:predicted RNA-binding Zn-ribbon protein involved in translation (DUF1610 family)